MDELDSLLAQFVSHRLGKVSCQNLVVGGGDNVGGDVVVGDVVGGDGRVVQFHMDNHFN